MGAVVALLAVLGAGWMNWTRRRVRFDPLVAQCLQDAYWLFEQLRRREVPASYLVEQGIHQRMLGLYPSLAFGIQDKKLRDLVSEMFAEYMIVSVLGRQIELPPEDRSETLAGLRQQQFAESGQDVAGRAITRLAELQRRSW